MDAGTFLGAITHASWYRGQMAHVQELAPRDALYGEPPPLQPALVGALSKQGFFPLYRHQAQAVAAVLGGANVIVSTPAASGKSLCYHLPVLTALLEDSAATALYLYPTKALAQDQLRGLQALVPQGMEPRAAIFDGDTPAQERGRVRRSARVLLTNPDMLHVGILPRHRLWSRLLCNLRYVVLDEAHVYRGIFGSHVANLLRRLRRLCLYYGSDPRFVLCSATLANPAHLAERLTGLPFLAVEEDGSPFGGKHFAFWNPPIINQATGARRSPASEATQLLVELLRRHVRTLVFVRSRRAAELVYVYVRDQLRQSAPEMAGQVRPYHAAYLPEERREVEQALFSGGLMAVVATSALELGIDVGSLEATVLTGYPGSIASTWQQAGRSGRRGTGSLSILVAQDNPLDQYLMRHPEFFFGHPHEQALVSPENRHVLAPHLLCAAYEAPLTEADSSLFGPGFHERVRGLEKQGFLRTYQGRWHLEPAVGYPAQEVNLRSASSDHYLLVEAGSGRILERVEEFSAFAQLHPGAVYLHQGEPYLVQALDMESRTASASPTDAPYHTQSRDVTDIRIVEVRQEKQVGGVQVCLGDVEVTTQVVGFRRKAYLTEEVLADEPLELPARSFGTVALWFGVPQQVLERVRRERLDLAGGLHAAEHAAIGVLPLFALCDRADIGGVSTPLHPDTGVPQVFIYDGHPGGIGIAERGYETMRELWQATYHAVSECPCEAGCPGCIQSPKCGNNNQPLDKRVALLLLGALLGQPLAAF
ncbi:MAG: DEAD/DEAH box helicase [Chloroflexi bacterium]|nr:DEAD/DEAH box helicase [Chloroflexota bacterium]